MPATTLHRFESDGKRFVIDSETCFCFECDAISWDVLEYYPQTPANHILHLLEDRYARKELEEVIGELEWLRSCKSILPALKQEDLPKTYELERGLKRLTVVISEAVPGAVPKSGKGWFASGSGAPAAGAPEWFDEAVNLLLARSGPQKTLDLELRFPASPSSLDRWAARCAAALKTARMAGKELTVAFHVTPLTVAKPPRGLAGHVLGARLELQHPADPLSALREYAAALNQLGALAKVFQSSKPGIGGRLTLVPGGPDFSGAVEVLHEAGFRAIDIDLDSAFVRNRALDPEAMLGGLHQAAVYYAKRLLEHKYFRLDPVAPLFLRIYHGTPERRSDPAGLHELAIDPHGVHFPSPLFIGNEEFVLGSVTDGTLDEDHLRRFEDVGALTTPECLRCWARNLCGGGTAAVHQALSGSFRQPHEPWCDAQRAWMERAVAAFNLLSSEGVNFTRMYSYLGHTAKPSLFQMVRAAFRMNVGLRPIEEADAALLTRWENWNDAAYFTFTESGMLIATRYDREMDSLHPRGYEQEFILIRKNGGPFGLLKIRPDRIPGTALVWIYMRNAEDYTSAAVRKSFQTLLKEVGGQQGLRALLTPVGPAENPLAMFLQSVGFEPAGELREALYLHGDYHPVRLFRAKLDD
jgi:uncharacterized protein